MYSKLQTKTVKPNFFSTAILEKLQQWATVVAFMAEWLRTGLWTWFLPTGRNSTGFCYVGVVGFPRAPRSKTLFQFKVEVTVMVLYNPAKLQIIIEEDV